MYNKRKNPVLIKEQGSFYLKGIDEQIFFIFEYIIYPIYRFVNIEFSIKALVDFAIDRFRINSTLTFRIFDCIILL